MMNVTINISDMYPSRWKTIKEEKIISAIASSPGKQHPRVKDIDPKGLWLKQPGAF